MRFVPSAHGDKLSSPSPGIIWSTAFLASSSGGEEEMGFWDGNGLRSYWMSQCGSCYWMSVCFWDAGNPFTLTASPSCWLAIWTLWKTAEWRGLKIQTFPVCGGSAHLWVSVGQMIPVTAPWWRLGVDSCSGDLYQLARRKGALTEMLLHRALAGKPFLNVPLAGNVISQVLQNSSNRPLCHVYRPNVFPAEVRFSSYVLGGFLGGWAPEPGKPAIWQATLILHMCTHPSRDLCFCIGTNPFSCKHVSHLPFCNFSFWKSVCSLEKGEDKQDHLSDKVAVTSHQCLRAFASLQVQLPILTRLWEAKGHQDHMLYFISGSVYFFSMPGIFSDDFHSTSKLPYCDLLHVPQGFKAGLVLLEQVGRGKSDLIWNISCRLFTDEGRKVCRISSFGSLLTGSEQDFNLELRSP